jgi:hypothetical protein
MGSRMKSGPGFGRDGEGGELVTILIKEPCSFGRDKEQLGRLSLPPRFLILQTALTGRERATR